MTYAQLVFALNEAGWRIVRTAPICCEKCEDTNGVRITDELFSDDSVTVTETGMTHDTRR